MRRVTGLRAGIIGFGLLFAALAACGSDYGMTTYDAGSSVGYGGSTVPSGVAGTGGIGGMMMGAGGMMMGAGGMPGNVTCHANGTLQVVNSGISAYVIDGASNPDLTLCRGGHYVFAVNAPGHPFYINKVRGTGTSNAYSTGVVGNGATAGDVTFDVPADAPSTLYYNCAIHAAMTGTIHIVD